LRDIHKSKLQIGFVYDDCTLVLKMRLRATRDDYDFMSE